MAIFRNIQMSFWTDPKIADDFTPDDKLFYLYLMTNPHTNLCGCYEVSIKQMSDETGFTKERTEKLVRRMEETHKTIIYAEETREVLIVNWHKYNWTSSAKFRVPLSKEIENVKNVDFKAFLVGCFNGIDTVSIPYRYRSDTTDSVTVTDSDSITDIKQVYGEYKHIKLNNKEINRLFNDYGESETLEAIKFLDEYKQRKGYTCKDDNLTLRKWVFDAVRKEKAEKAKRDSQPQSLLDKWMNA